MSSDLRAVGLAEQAVLVAGALGRDVEVVTPTGARASATVTVDNGKVTRVDVTLAAGDPLDEVVLRSYAIGAAHMALGWVTSEGLAVDGNGRDPRPHDPFVRRAARPRRRRST